MIERQPHIDLSFDIDSGTRELPPRRHSNAQQNGTAYIWNSTTQELLPILPKDHTQYRESMDRVLAAIRRWNKGKSW
jgi:hypothetical protein